MFKKKKPAQSPYPKQQYADVPSEPVSYPSPQHSQYGDQKYQQQAGAGYAYSSSSSYIQQAPSAPPIYGEPPPPYSKFPEPQQPAHSHQGQYQQTPYPQHSSYNQTQYNASPYPPQSQGTHYPSGAAAYPTNYSYPAQPMSYLTGPAPHTVVAVGGFDAGARFNAGAAPVVPPAPPGVVPNAAQMGVSQGHNVVATQRSTNWFTGGSGGGPIF